ncbi:MAG: hypothetical protein Q8908_06965 [Bacteroidota bacterium]|nr:hypothetical protein [Bacteroidota bacterium]
MKTEWQHYHDSLFLKYGAKKVFVKEFELQALIALSYYPELADVPITFRQRDIKTTMAVRPEYFSALRNQGRKYIIFIDNDIHNNDGILLRDIPFNAQIGIMGHELAHIMDYEHRSVLGIVMLALNYVTFRNHAQYEKSIDRFAIRRGLGWQELEFADFIENNSKASMKYKHFKKVNYLSPAEIEDEIAKTKLYSSFQDEKKWNAPYLKKR